MRTVSGPMLPVSSGTLPGHSSTTVGLSAPTAGEVTHNHVMRETSATIRFMVAPLESGTQPRHQQHGALPTPTRAYRPRAMAADQRGVLPRTLSTPAVLRPLPGDFADRSSRGLAPGESRSCRAGRFAKQADGRLGQHLARAGLHQRVGYLVAAGRTGHPRWNVGCLHAVG